MGPLTHTFCHTTPIRIPKDTGMVWGEAYDKESLESPLTQAASNSFFTGLYPP